MSSSSASSYSSSSTNMIPRNNYDVFVSFRGEDTRDNFLSHLHKALVDKQVRTFIDNQLTKGNEISQSLLNVIEGSNISVVIFSKGYASSTWCLDELVRILECKRMRGQIVIPVFYWVDPSDVRKQTGIFGDAFLKLEERFKERLDKLQGWRIALTEAANLSGFDSHVTRPESVLVEKIVEVILKRLNDMVTNEFSEDLVGVESCIREIESWLSSGLIDVYTLGIWGIGGIGKTTIAAAIFKKISSHFDASYFIENVSEEAEKAGGLAHLRRELHSTLLDNENLTIRIPSFGINFGSTRISRKKVLIVFDDVTDFKQIESLIGSFDWFMPGTLIVITTRNKQVLKNCGVKKIYEVKKLVDADALKLFCRHAFAQNYPDVGFKELSKKLMQYAQGLPLALKVLGRFLFGRSKGDWESAINKLKRIPHNDIQKVLKVSYDGLDDKEKNIFLDIACFFKGEKKDLVVNFLNACGLFAEIGLSVLVDKSLISVSNNKVTMHDLIQEMGKEIVWQESVNDPGKRSRLWHHEEIYKVLTYNTGSKAIQGISLDMSKVKKIHLNDRIFRKMHNLRFLKFYGKNKFKMSRSCVSRFTKLSYFQWDGYPLKSLPIHPENLVSLQLLASNIKQLWDGVQDLVNLKRMDLTCSKRLKKLPDLSKAKNLEYLILARCSSLVETHSSIQYLTKLVMLNLRDCKSLKILPRSIHSEFLEELILFGCSNLKAVPEFSFCILKELDLISSAIEELPSSIDCLSRLSSLRLRDCKRLKSLPSSLCNLESLRFLDLSDCSNLKRLPKMSSCDLEELYLAGTAIEELPPSIEYLSRLVSLNLFNCSRLEHLPRSICKLKSLKHLYLSGCSNLQKLPEELGNLEDLKTLLVERTGIREVPSSIVRLKNLDGLYFERFKGHEQMGFILPILFSSDGLLSLRHMNLNDCGITELPESLGHLSLLETLHLEKNNFERIPEGIISLSKLSELKLDYCKRLRSLPKFPCSLQYMDANQCMSLEALSGFSNLFTFRSSPLSLKFFELRNCFKLDWNELREIFEDDPQKFQRLAIAWSKNLYQRGDETTFFKLIFPGSKIPEWFRYQSMGSSITLELPTTTWFNDNFLGFAFSAVVAFEEQHYRNLHFCLCCELKVKAEDGRWLVNPGGRCYLERSGFVDSKHLHSDHVCFGYHLSSKFGHGFREYWYGFRAHCYSGEAFFEFYIMDGLERLECCDVVKKCGIHLLYAQDFEESLKDRGRSFNTNEEDEQHQHLKRLKYTRSSF